jgi:hypothetical protein
MIENSKEEIKLRQLTPGEVLSLSTLLTAETNALTVAKAGYNTITDEQLKSLTQAGISATQARIAGLQEFISENLGITGEIH